MPVDQDPEGAHCATCSAQRVVSSRRATAIANEVHSTLARSRKVAVPYNFDLRLTHSLNDDQLGLHRGSAVGEQRSSTVLVRSGLPALQFAQVVAHEISHGWLWACGPSEGVSQLVNEGVAELCSFWLMGQIAGTDPRAESIRLGLSANSDPIYGHGLRQALLAERIHSWEVVRRCLLAEGQLPL